MPDAVTDTHALLWHLQDDLLKEINSEETIYSVVGLTLPVVINLRNIPRSVVADLPDRIIAATALYLKLPLITRDSKINLSDILTIW